MGDVWRAVGDGRALAAVLLCGALSSARAQQDDALNQLQQPARGQVRAILDSARRSGLPVAPIRFKVSEGVNKHVDDQRIVVVAHSILLALRDARAVLGPVDDEQLIVAAGALQGAMKPEVLLRERGAAKGHSITWAFSILADLVRLGVPHQQATAAAAHLWRSGATDDVMYGLWSDVTADVRRGTKPGDALRARMKGIRSGQ